MENPSEPRRWGRFLLKLVISLGLVGAVLGLADISHVGKSFAAIDGMTIVAAVGLCFSQMVLAGIRWHVLAGRTGIVVGWWRVMRVTFAAMFCNQLLPTSIGGDLVRIGLLARLSVPAGHAARTVVLDRAAGMLSLLTLMTITGIVLGERLPAGWPVPFFQALPVLAIMIVLGGMLVGDRAADLVERRLKFAWAAQLLRDSSRLMRGGFSTLVILLLSYAIHIASAASIWILARGSGVEIEFIEVLGFLPIVILIILVPISIAGWGVREGTIVTLFALLGIGSAPAFAVSILWGAAIAVGAILGGAIWFITRESGERLPDHEDRPDTQDIQAP
jgi:glycosyltransferase 2 family protein